MDGMVKLCTVYEGVNATTLQIPHNRRVKILPNNGLILRGFPFALITTFELHQNCRFKSKKIPTLSIGII